MGFENPFSDLPPDDELRERQRRRINDLGAAPPQSAVVKPREEPSATGSGLPGDSISWMKKTFAPSAPPLVDEAKFRANLERIIDPNTEEGKSALRMFDSYVRMQNELSAPYRHKYGIVDALAGAGSAGMLAWAGDPNPQRYNSQMIDRAHAGNERDLKSIGELTSQAFAVGQTQLNTRTAQAREDAKAGMTAHNRMVAMGAKKGKLYTDLREYIADQSASRSAGTTGTSGPASTSTPSPTARPMPAVPGTAIDTGTSAAAPQPPIPSPPTAQPTASPDANTYRKRQISDDQLLPLPYSNEQINLLIAAGLDKEVDNVRQANEAVLKQRAQQIQLSEVAAKRAEQNPQDAGELEFAKKSGAKRAEVAAQTAEMQRTASGINETLARMYTYPDNTPGFSGMVGAVDAADPFGVRSALGSRDATEMRAKIQADIGGILAKTKGLVRTAGEGAWTDKDQEALEVVAGKLLSSADGTEFKRRLEDFNERLGTTFTKPYGVEMKPLAPSKAAKADDPPPPTTPKLTPEIVTGIRGDYARADEATRAAILKDLQDRGIDPRVVLGEIAAPQPAAAASVQAEPRPLVNGGDPLLAFRYGGDRSQMNATQKSLNDLRRAIGDALGGRGIGSSPSEPWKPER